MSIDEAIMRIRLVTALGELKDQKEFQDALELGIEALKYIRAERYADYPHHIPPLKGE